MWSVEVFGGDGEMLDLIGFGACWRKFKMLYWEVDEEDSTVGEGITRESEGRVAEVVVAEVVWLDTSLVEDEGRQDDMKAVV